MPGITKKLPDLLERSSEPPAALRFERATYSDTKMVCQVLIVGLTSREMSRLRFLLERLGKPKLVFAIS